jgi:nucleoside-diphosphate-sugar epimerase
LPVTIARLNTVLGPHSAYHGLHLRAIEAGREIVVPGDPNAHSPIHSDDMIAMIAPLLDGAATNALIVNWCGDDVVTTQESAALTAARLGKSARLRVEQHPGVPMGNAADTVRRMSITGPCKVRFDDGLNRLIDEMTGEKAHYNNGLDAR